MNSVSFFVVISVWTMTGLPSSDPAKIPFALPAAKAYADSSCFSSDKKTLIIGGSSGENFEDPGQWLAWDLESGKAPYRGSMKGRTAHCVAMSPDEKLLAAGSDGAELKVFEVASGKVLAELPGHRSAVSKLGFSPDGKYLVSVGSNDNMLRIWSMRDYQPQATYCFTSKDSDTAEYWKQYPPKSNEVAKTTVIFDEPIKKLRCFSIAPDGLTMAVTTSNQSVLILELLTGKVASKIETTHESGVYSVRFSPDGKTLATGSGNVIDAAGTIEIHQVATGKRLLKLEKHKETVLSLAFSEDGKFLVSGGFDGAKLWDLTTGKQIHHVSSHKETYFHFVSFLADGKTFVTAGGLGPARFWDVTTGKETSPSKNVSIKIDEHSQAPWDAPFGLGESGGRHVFQCCLAPDEKVLCIGGEQDWSLWDLDSGKKQLGGSMEHRNTQAAAIAPNGKFLAVGSLKAELKVFDTITGKVLAKLEGHHEAVVQTAFTSLGKHLLSRAADNTIRIWNTLDWSPRFTLSFYTEDQYKQFWRGHGEQPDEKTEAVVPLPKKAERVYGFSLSPDDTFIAVITGARQVLLVELLTGKVLKTIESEQVEGAWVTAFSPDGKTLAVGSGSGSTPGNIELWDLASGQLKAALKGHAQIVDAIAFSPNGQTLGSGGWDGARVWDLKTGKQIHHLLDTGDELNRSARFVSFLAGGKLFMTAGGRGPARFWDTATGKEKSPITKEPK